MNEQQATELVKRIYMDRLAALAKALPEISFDTVSNIAGHQTTAIAILMGQADQTQRDTIQGILDRE